MRGYKSFASEPHPGRLCHRVSIGYTKEAVNANGFPEATDVVVCKTWSAIEDAGNEYYRAADALNTEAVLNFTIRHRNGIVPGMWVLYNGEKWIIRTLGQYNFRRTYLGLKADRQLGVSG